MRCAGSLLRSLIALGLLLGGAAFAAAADPEDAGAPASPLPTLELPKPATPVASKKDWVQLKSGEWLRGAIKRMRDASIEFDSDELDDLTIEWKDIIEVRSPLSHTYVFERDRHQFSVTGPARVDKTTVSVQLGEEVHEFPRTELVAILRGESRRDYWSGSLSFGLTMRTGNTELVEFANLGWVRRETDRTRLRLDYNGAYGSLNGDINSNSHRAVLSFDYFLTRKLYVTPLRMEYFSDEFQNISYRLIPSVTLGYKLMRRGSLEWDVDVGAGYQFTHFDLGGASEEGGAIIFGTRFETDLTKQLDVAFNYKLNLALSSASQTSHHAEFILSIDLYKAIDLDINLTWDRIANPNVEDGAPVPEENDARLVVGIGVDF